MFKNVRMYNNNYSLQRIILISYLKSYYCIEDLKAYNTIYMVVPFRVLPIDQIDFFIHLKDYYNFLQESF